MSLSCAITHQHVSECYVWRVNNKAANSFDVNSGIKQGGRGRWCIHSYFTEPLTGNLMSCQLGCYVGEKCASIFVYVDHIILWSPFKSAIQNLLNKGNTFANEGGLKFNPLNASQFFDDIILTPLYIDGAPLSIAETEKEKHLSHWISSRGYYIQRENIAKDLKMRSNYTKREFQQLDYATKCKLFNAQCTDPYGCRLMNISTSQSDSVYMNSKWIPPSSSFKYA